MTNLKTTVAAYLAIFITVLCLITYLLLQGSASMRTNLVYCSYTSDVVPAYQAVSILCKLLYLGL